MAAKDESSPYHHGNLRVGLIEAALARLSGQTAETLSLRELAKTVGVSIAAVYRHFPNKDALLAEVATDGFNKLVLRWERELPAADDVGAEARFQRLGEIYVEFALASPAHYRLMFVQGDLRCFPDLQAAAERCFAYVLRAATATVKEAGVSEKWALATAGAAWSIVHGYIMLSLGGLMARNHIGPELTPDLLPRFLQLPAEAFTDQ